MRRKPAASECLGCSAALSRVPTIFIVFFLWGAPAVRGTDYALTVTTAEALHEAFLNNNVTLIYLGQDISLSRNAWGEGAENASGHSITVERNLTLTSHPSLNAPAVLYLDYVQHGVLAGTNVYLRINGVVMTGVSQDARNLFFVPFFQFQSGGTIYLENSQFQMAIDPENLWPLDAYPAKMNTTARPTGYEHWPVESYVIDQKDCELNALRETKCDEGAIWVASLSARLTIFDQHEDPIGKAAFLAENVLIVAEAVGDAEPVEHKTAVVSTAMQFKKALQNPLITEIQIEKDIRLSKRVFSPSIRTPITRNLTIKSSPRLHRHAVIDLDYLQSAIVAGEDIHVTLQDLNLTRVSKDPRNYELVPFFSLLPGAMYLYRNITSEMALSPVEFYPLKQLAFQLYGGDVPPSYGNISNSVEAVSSKWCARHGHIRCPDGALYIKRGIRRLRVLDVANQDVLGEGFVDIQESLIKIIDITKNDLNTLTQPYANPKETEEKSHAGGKKANLQETDSASEEEHERKSFGFVGGFDPWILIYALIAAAMVLGVCLFVMIHRRRRDQKSIQNNRHPVKRSESFTAEDDGRNAHQKIAQQLLGDVKLGTLLGCGSFGRVYKAMWSGAQVAVKTILHQEDAAEVEQEAQFSISLRHPNVVQTFHYAVRTADISAPTPKGEDKESAVVNIDCQARCSPAVPIDNGMNIPSSWMKTSNGGEMFKNNVATGSGQSSAIRTDNPSRDFTEERWMEMWLIQEYCNLGSLGKQNHLRVNDQPSAWGSRYPGMQAIIDTCKDISRGMKYLHDNGIVHGDLKCDNVLLQSSHVEPKGFTAKVADFGLSRKLGPSTHLSTKSFGTITHMPPELLLEGHLSSKVDVYSFGVIMWELVTGRQPFRELRYAEVMRAIVVDNKRPTFDPDTQEEYVVLAQRCWDRDPSKRPSFESVLIELDKMCVDAVEASSFDSSAGSWAGESDDDESPAGNKKFST